ncbi:MAG TPA: thioredoxin domain-containing protein [Clostridiaceae bacterium]|nr:thioredoxin domain-containing protein [Clostridiaceae bacterium]
MSTNRQANRLIHEKSPYLLQHAYNPVDWFPWSDEAFEKAKSEDKPVFLSIGYSTCHWCHVMERESFEDEEIASILNEYFIAVKVDREERPDIDSIYMAVCQALTGHGGWPLTVFLTPDKKPFFAGTYFPKEDRMGMMGLKSLLNRVVELWNSRRNELISSSNKITNMFNSPLDFQEEDIQNEDIPEDLVHDAFTEFKYAFDSIYGGFGSAPKFPTPHNLYFLLRYWHATGEDYALEMVEKTLDSMYRGGIFDHIGFGFSRYSTDRRWLVPHFEKMLYDNALLAIAYIETYQATGKKIYAETAHKIFTYVLRDMTSPEGAFYSAEDADSEGVEGKFYLWTPSEVKDVLGEEAGTRFCKFYDITERGNFEGKNILNLIDSDTSGEDMNFIEECRNKLFLHREKRVHPYKDDKILTAWNGLMIAALSIGGRVLGEQKYTAAAEKALQFILGKLVRPGDGRLLARYRDGEAAFPAYVDDYAFLVWGLIELYNTTFKPEYLGKALQLNDDMIELFFDNEHGGLYLYGNDGEQLIARPKEVYDGAMPSGNSVATMNFLRLARLTGQSRLEELAGRQFKVFSNSLTSNPLGHAFLLCSFLFAHSAAKEVVISGSNSRDKEILAMIGVLRNKFNPFTTVLLSTDDLKDIVKIAPFAERYERAGNKAAAYLCENFSCQAPVYDSESLSKLLYGHQMN